MKHQYLAMGLCGFLLATPQFDLVAQTKVKTPINYTIELPNGSLTEDDIDLIEFFKSFYMKKNVCKTVDTYAFRHGTKELFEEPYKGKITQVMHASFYPEDEPKGCNGDRLSYDAELKSLVQRYTTGIMDRKIDPEKLTWKHIISVENKHMVVTGANLESYLSQFKNNGKAEIIIITMKNPNLK